MDLLNDNIGKLFRRYLIAAFGSALISSIYSLVDMAMVGQYHGPDGSAAMAVIAPVWNFTFCFGLLIGIGGSVLYAVKRGESGELKEPNGIFTVSVILAAVVGAVLWIILLCFEEPLLYLFGANKELLPLCKDYLVFPKLAVPTFVFADVLASFLRNDCDPALATKGVIFGGVFNVFGDYFFVFTCDMGIKGAGLATALGISVSVFTMLTHFLKKSNTLKFVKPEKPAQTSVKIFVNGFSSFAVDIAMGIMTILFNRVIMDYLNADALAVYGVIVTVSTFVQCCSYGVGQAAQPLLSQNFGAGKTQRIKVLLKYSIVTSAVIGAIWTAISIFAPNMLVKVFMEATPSVLNIAPAIIRVYAISFLLLPFNIFAAYYFQSVMQPVISNLVSIARGAVISGALILALPVLFGGNAVWWALPITELLVATFCGFKMRTTVKR